MICVTSPGELELSQKQQADIWKAFLGGGTSHSALAGTLPFIMRRCEREKIAYTLHAKPGMGYWIEPMRESKL